MADLRLRNGWPAIANWALASALVVFSALGIMTIGWFIMPFAIWACYRAAFRYSLFPDGVSGIMFGAGAVILVIAFLNRDYVPCPTGGIIVFPGDTGMHHCGGSDPMPWFRTGAALTMIGATTLVLFRRLRITRSVG